MLRIGYGEAKTDEGSLTAYTVFAERDPSPVAELRSAPPSPTRGEGNTLIRR